MPLLGYDRTGLGISDETGERDDSGAVTPDNGLDGGSSSGRLEGPASTSSGTTFARHQSPTMRGFVMSLRFLTLGLSGTAGESLFLRRLDPSGKIQPVLNLVN